MNITLPKFVALSFFTCLLIASHPCESAGEESTVSIENKITRPALNNISGTLQVERSLSANDTPKKTSIKGDVFGRKKKIIHPFIAVRESYSDNIYNDDDNRESDFATLLSTGFRISYPSLRKNPLNIKTSTMVPGGLTRYSIEPLRRINYRAYFFYGYDHELFAGNSSQNTGSHNIETSYQYRFGKSSLSIADKYTKSHDKRGEGGTGELNEYTSNLINLSYDYVKSSKFRYNLVYSLFSPHYTTSVSEFRNRNDWALSGSVYYRMLPKTSIFGEYRYVRISYDGDERLSSKEHHIFVGLNWKLSSKSAGTAKVGYGLKQFDSLSSEEHSDILLSLGMSHRFSSKNSISLSLSRMTSETNQPGSVFVLSHDMSLTLRHRYSPKTVLSIGFDLSHDNYEGRLPATTGQEESNTTIGASLSADYRINRVFSAGAGYSYHNKKAEPSIFDYTTNEVFIFISAML